MRVASSGNMKKERLTLVLPRNSMDRLNLLREETEASTNAEVFKNALRLYEAILAEVKAGREFCIKETKDGKETLTAYRFFL